MSANAKAALEDAIKAVIEEEDPGAVVTGYVLLAANLTPEDLENHDGTHYFFTAPEGQPYHSTLGLTHRLRLLVENGDTD